jgi:F-type H+-transporting ATPase subunit a
MAILTGRAGDKLLKLSLLIFSGVFLLSFQILDHALKRTLRFIFALLALVGKINFFLAGTIVVGIFLMAFALAARLALASNKNYLVPPERLSFLNLADIASENLFGMTKSILGHDAPIYFPVVGGLFLFIFISNLFGLLPGFAPPTQNINTNLACGAFVFLYYNYQGFKATGWKYLLHFFGPVWYMAWLLLPIEIISHVVRPFTLALRLKGNMVGDHTVLSVFTNLVPYVVPVPFYFLGLLVCFIQSFIFVMLTMVYISLAKESDHH